MASKKPNIQKAQRLLVSAQAFNEIDGEKANAKKDEAIMALFEELGWKNLAIAYDNVVKLYEDQTRRK